MNEFLLLCLIVMVPAGLMMIGEIKGQTPGTTVKNALAWIAIYGGCLFVVWATGYVHGFPPPWFK
jgi:hypothetical protein